MPRGSASYLNHLTISHRGKGIPYGGLGEIREDGGANHGFRNLKGRPHLIDLVPELRSDPALRSLVLTVNAAHTALFTIGCVSGPVPDTDGHGHRYSGYIEFALNSRSAVEDGSSSADYCRRVIRRVARIIVSGWDLRAIRMPPRRTKLPNQSSLIRDWHLPRSCGHESTHAGSAERGGVECPKRPDIPTTYSAWVL